VRIAICIKKDIHGLIAARVLARALPAAELGFFCSVKTRGAEGDIPGLRLLKLLEREIAIDALATQQRQVPGVPHPDAWVPLTDLKRDGGAATLLAFRPDLVLSVRFSLIFPERVIGAVPLGIINVHPGALPGYRGLFAPFWQVARGERSLHCTVHRVVDRGIDTGPILGVATVPVDPRRSLLWHSAALYRGGSEIAAARALRLMQGETLDERPQPSGGAYWRFPAEADFAQLPMPLVTARDYATVLAEAFDGTHEDRVAAA
jgi:methionyl-tRNA formyltransferase